MALKRYCFFAVLVLSYMLLLTACCPQQDANTSTDAYRVVTQIHVVYQKDRIVSERKFTVDEKMQQILLYLRQISPYGIPAQDPEEVPGSVFYITLHYSDGTQKVYQQRADRFMRINGGPWKRIDPKRAVKLSQILGMMDSDTPAQNSTAPFLTD